MWYPPAGLALVLLLVVGSRAAPVVFVANAIGATIDPGIVGWWDPWLFPAIITSILTVVALLVRRLHGARLLPGTTRETVVFAVVTVATPALIAMAGTTASHQLGFIPEGKFLESAIRWWVGDASGILTILPVGLLLASSWLRLPGAKLANPIQRPRELAAFTARLAVLAGCLWTAFRIDPQAEYSTYFLTFLPLVWISVRHGLHGATVGTLVLTMGSLIGLHITQASTPQTISFLVFELTVAVVGLGIGATVSRRNAVEAELQSSEARLDRVLTGAHLGFWDWEPHSGKVTYNERCAEILGVSLGELAGIDPTWQAFAHPDDRLRIADALAAHVDGRTARYEADFRVRTRSGQWRWIHARGSVSARDALGRPITVSGTHLDITDRIQAEAEAQRLMQIIERTTDLVLTTDLEGRILHANASLLHQLGHATVAGLRGHTIDDALPASALDTIRRQAIPAALRARSWLGETVLHDSSGRPLPVSLVVLLHRCPIDDHELLSFIMRDVSQQKAIEAEKLSQERRVQQLQRSESLGVLAGGIAHDFNNLLTTVLGNANLARLDLPAEGALHESLGQIESAAARAGELCQLMLAYAGRAPLQLADLDLSLLVEDTRELLSASTGHRVELAFDLTAGLPTIHAARAQMQQVLVNLVHNAVQAMGDQPGRVMVRTRQEHLDGRAAARRSLSHPIEAGAFIVLEVEDNGPGMSPETKARIFEPFFTTRVAGHGLGLAAVHGIVRSHEGAIEVLSEPGRGCLFRIFLPTRSPPAQREGTARTEPTRNQAKGLALVVDDEPGVRRTATLLMQSLGYETINAADGEEGVNQFRRYADCLDVVLMDVTMPRLDGDVACARMRSLRREVPVILMSGYTERLSCLQSTEHASAGFLPKPFDRAALVATLNAALPTRRERESKSPAVHCTADPVGA